VPRKTQIADRRLKINISSLYKKKTLNLYFSSFTKFHLFTLTDRVLNNVKKLKMRVFAHKSNYRIGRASNSMTIDFSSRLVSEFEM